MAAYRIAIAALAAAAALLGTVMLGFRMSADSDGNAVGLRRRLQAVDDDDDFTITTTSTTTTRRCGSLYNLPIPDAPMCTTCRSPRGDVPPDIDCKINTTACDSLGPGLTCHISCAAPYVGAPVEARCLAGNSNPARPLNYTGFPNCGCPDPAVIPPNYRKNVTTGGWECNAAGYYAGTPVHTCGCGQPNQLSGCESMVPCAAPIVDECRYDVSDCGNVAPGETCSVNCRHPFSGGPTLALCPHGNVNNSRELMWMPLRCTLTDCADPANGSTPAGYLPSSSGWQCDAAGPQRYYGVPRKRCTPSANWHSSCTTEAEFEGCDKVVRCVAPTLSGIDYCRYDAQTCTIDDNSTCKVHCKSPFRGVSTTAKCPLNNVLVNGLEVEFPTCWLDEDACADPEVIPTGYVRMAVGFDCALGFTGSPVKTCHGTAVGNAPPTCGTRPVMSGCVKRVPCEYEKLDPPADTCRYDLYNCASVPDGSSCEIRCKAPFSGDTSRGICITGNTDPAGLMWTPPTCNITTCIDPYPVPAGYVKTASRIEALSWACETGYTGTALKICTWNQTQCEASPTLEGCTREVPCKPMALNDQQQCMFNLTAQCNRIASGSGCNVGCALPYMGAPVRAVCPTDNLDPNTSLVWGADGEPTCNCPDPIVAPLGYEKNSNGQWICSGGYVGTPRKDCSPSVSNNCLAEPRMLGCAPPVPCAVATVEDDRDPRPNMLHFEIFFGPAVADGMMSEDAVIDYAVYFADSCDYILGDAILLRDETERMDDGPRATTRIEKSEALERYMGCCYDSVYHIEITAGIPHDATQLMVIANTTTGMAPTGRSIPIVDVGTLGVVGSSAPPSLRLSWLASVAFLVAVTAAGRRHL